MRVVRVTWSKIGARGSKALVAALGGAEVWVSPSSRLGWWDVWSDAGTYSPGPLGVLQRDKVQVTRRSNLAAAKRAAEAHLRRGGSDARR